MPRVEAAVRIALGDVLARARGCTPIPDAAALLGRGIGASRTPGMHEAEGAQARASAISTGSSISTISALPTPISQRRSDAARTVGLNGVNVTHPFKEAVVGCLDELSPDAAAIGAVNTLVFSRQPGHGAQHGQLWLRRELQAGPCRGAARPRRAVRRGRRRHGSRPRAPEAWGVASQDRGQDSGEGAVHSRQVSPAGFRAAMLPPPATSGCRPDGKRGRQRHAERNVEVSRQPFRRWHSSARNFGSLTSSTSLPRPNSYEPQGLPDAERSAARAWPSSRRCWLSSSSAALPADPEQMSHHFGLAPAE